MYWGERENKRRQEENCRQRDQIEQRHYARNRMWFTVNNHTKKRRKVMPT